MSNNNKPNKHEEGSDDLKLHKSTKNYQDLGGLSDRYLNLGLWLAENRKRIKQGIVIFLLVFSASTLSFSLYQFAIYFFYERDAHQQMLEEISSDPASYELRQLLAPKNILFYFVRSFNVQGRYDFIGKIYNPNPRHRASFNYCFEEGGRELACGNTFILPEEEKYVLELGKSLEDNVSSPQLVIKEISWQRITPHQITDWQEYYNKRVYFDIKIEEFAVINNNSYSLRFAIENKSTFGYYELPLQIILFNEQGESGANRYMIRQILAGEKMTISLVWPAGAVRSSRAVIIPEVDVLDDQAFIFYGGEAR